MPYNLPSSHNMSFFLSKIQDASFDENETTELSAQYQVLMGLFVSNGYSMPAAVKAMGYEGDPHQIASHLFRVPAIKRWMAQHANKMQQEGEADREIKISLLRDAMMAYYNQKDYVKMSKIINVLNIMQGHLAPVKIQTVNVNYKHEEIKKLLAEKGFHGF